MYKFIKKTAWIRVIDVDVPQKPRRSKSKPAHDSPNVKLQRVANKNAEVAQRFSYWIKLKIGESLLKVYGWCQAKQHSAKGDPATEIENNPNEN